MTVAAAHRHSLFRKYAAILVLLVGGVLVASQAIGLALDYSGLRQAAANEQSLEARVAVADIDAYLGSIERQVREVHRLPWNTGLLGVPDQRLEFHRLMKIVPAIAEMRFLGADGRERLVVSRTDRDEAGSGRKSEHAGWIPASGGEVSAWSPVSFMEGSEPYSTLAVGDARSGFTLATLDLRFIGDVVSRIRIGDAGRVFVVDRDGKLIAHRDPSLVLRQTSIANSPIYDGIEEHLLREGHSTMPMLEARSFDGRRHMISATTLAVAPWIVVAEQPRDEVLAPLYQRLLRTVLLTVAGLLLAVAASALLARRLAQPIQLVRQGAERIARGELATRIDIRTGDEVEALANQFNGMADQLEGYTERLHQRVAEKTMQLERANRHKTEFLAHMSHELRTPLNAVIGFSEALGECIFGPLNRKQAEYVRDINASGQHLLSLINDILDLSKIEAGRMELDLRHFDVPAALQNCRALVRERAMRQGIALESRVEPGLGVWNADERKFKQIVVNLLSNAVKFTPTGGRITLEAHTASDGLEVSVADTGPGIAAEELPTLFEGFRKVSRRGADSEEGSGLGLALTRRLVELHGGSIRVDSEPGAGSRFVVRFPRAAAGASHG